MDFPHEIFQQNVYIYIHVRISYTHTYTHAQQVGDEIVGVDGLEGVDFATAKGLMMGR